MTLSEQEQIARSKVCLPLDGLHTLDELKARIEQLHSVVGMFKIGKELFTRFGPQTVQLVHDAGSEVFLDLKFHDIPNTVEGAAYAATQLGVSMFNVHASGGREMLRAANAGARNACQNHNLRMPVIIGVTVLTSINQHILNTDVRVPGSLEEHVLALAKLSQISGLQGIVCSAADLPKIRHDLPPDFLYVTPGIKGPNTEAGNDQKRVMTPYNAIKDGAGILVIGRAIYGAPDPFRAGQEVLEDIVRAL